MRATMSSKQSAAFAAHRRVSPLRVAAWLLIAALATSLVVGTTLSRYASDATSADSARVAVFEVTQSGTLTQDFSPSYPIAPGEVVTFDVAVENKSEVAVECWIKASNATGNLPLEFEMQKETAEDQWEPVESDSIAPGDDAARSYRLVISWPKETRGLAGSGAALAEGGATDGDDGDAAAAPNAAASNQDPSYAGKADAVQITLTAVQID